MKIIRIISIIALLLGIHHLLQAQIALAPSFVFIDENSGVGNMYVSNNSDKAYEVSISFAFGYPDSDAYGNLEMNYEDSIAYEQYALDEMLRAFPRSFILHGGEQRTVRLQIVPGERRREGFFFTRMKVLARPQTPEVTEELTEGIGTKITFTFEQVTAVFYRRGQLSTGLLVKDVDVRHEGNTLQIRPQLHRTGNAPFLGSMFARLKDERGNVVAEAQSTTTAYFDVIRRMDLGVADVPAGQYKLELSFETRRNDMMASDLVQTPRIVHEMNVVLE
jgi:hypothetical protein